MSIETKEKELFHKDYTLENFKEEGEDRRMEIITTTVNHILRALTYLSMRLGEVYWDKKSLTQDFLDFVGIPEDDFYERKKYLQLLIPINETTYWSYVDVRRKWCGILTRINLVTKVESKLGKVGYTLTEFGEVAKGFVAFILKEFLKYDIDPWNFFGHTLKQKGKRSPVNAVLILKLLAERGESTSSKIAEEVGVGIYAAHYHLRGFESLGLVEYESVCSLRGEVIPYRVNRENLLEFIERWRKDEEKEKNRIREKRGYFHNWDYLIRICEYLKGKDEVSVKEVVEEVGVSKENVSSVFIVLRDSGILEVEKFKGGEKVSHVEITEKGKRFYHDVLKRLIEVVENPYSLLDYKDFYLNEDEIIGLLKIYASHRSHYRKRIYTVYEVIKKNPYISTDGIVEITGYKKGSVNWYLGELRRAGKIKSKKGLHYAV